MLRGEVRGGLQKCHLGGEVHSLFFPSPVVGWRELSRTGPLDFLLVRRCSEKICPRFSVCGRLNFNGVSGSFSLSASQQFSSVSSSGTFGADTSSCLPLESEREWREVEQNTLVENFVMGRLSEAVRSCAHGSQTIHSFIAPCCEVTSGRVVPQALCSGAWSLRASCPRSSS